MSAILLSALDKFYKESSAELGRETYSSLSMASLGVKDAFARLMTNPDVEFNQVLGLMATKESVDRVQQRLETLANK